MTYATQQDLVDRFGSEELVQLTDRTNTPATTIDTDVVADALADADALIDSYVGKSYALPLAIVPPILTRVAADIARFFLFGDRVEKDGAVDRANSAAIAWLKDVARGVVRIDDGSGGTPGAAGGGQIKTAAPDRVFSRDSLKGL
ncbi:MAG: DUF1320 domain-containing protein [Alphaproteobacteria bacterium]|nr:DUF1320 domain-containing protein [Alphaproteobacteria bacterium]